MMKAVCMMAVVVAATGVLANFPLTDRERTEFLKSVMSSRKANEPIKAANALECMLCKTLYTFVASIANEEEPVIQQKVDQLCQDMGPLASECTQLVNTYLPKLLASIQSGKDETEVCVNLLHLCDATMAKVEQQHRAEVVTSVGDSISCTICDVLYQVVVTMAGQDEQQIQAACDKACDDLGFLASTCKALVDQYLPQMIQAIQSGKDQQEVCANLLGLCSSAASNVKPKIPVAAAKSRSGAGQDCALCQMLYKFVATIIGEEESVIQQKVDDLCTSLGPLASECKTLVDQYLPAIIQGLQSQKDEDEVCTALLHLCTSVASRPMVALVPPPVAAQAASHPMVALLPPSVAMLVRPNRFGIIECEVCKLLVEVLQKAVADHDQSILQDLQKACDVLPGSFKNDCIDIVQKYGQELLNDIIQGAGDKACQLVDLC